jgi:serine/threonine protein kinase
MSYDQRVDFWSLGFVLFNWVEGSLDYENCKNPQQTTDFFEQLLQPNL